MSKPRLLDLFCGVGGAAEGYFAAGFDVTGVDVAPQPNYPFRFIQADALDFLTKPLAILSFTLEGYDAIHASPPCQAYTDLARLTKREYPRLIEPTRDLLVKTGLPYVIENVEGAPLRNPILLCGVERGLRLGKYVLRRHRLFESNIPLRSRGCGCHKGDGVTMAVYGGGNSNKPRTSAISGGRPYKGTAAERRAIMGVSWATIREINQAIPPEYTRFVGEQLRWALENVA